VTAAWGRYVEELRTSGAGADLPESLMDARDDEVLAVANAVASGHAPGELAEQAARQRQAERKARLAAH
jgi:hypothetical protein